jgi:arylsulfatase A-like enzyme
MAGRGYDEMIKAKVFSIVWLAVLSAAAQNPNIVVILADDMGWGDVGYHGFSDVHTPNIDKLAKSGTWFEQGYVTASVCGPSRAGLISGVYQQRFGFLGNGEKFIIPLDQPTLAERLKARGYRTGMLGKWHVGYEKDELPNARGFDFYYGSLTGSHDYFKSSTDPKEKKRSLLPIYRNDQIEPPLQERGDNLTRVYGGEAVDFIERNKDKPFFLYVAHNAVHYPWQAGDEDIERLKALKVHHEDRRFFAAMVLALDDSVGRVLQCLENHELTENTLVVFLTDNGTPRGHGVENPRPNRTRGTTTMSSPGPFNGFKGDVYEGGIRVPFLMSWPGTIPAGKRYPHPVISLDIAATAMGISSGSELTQGLQLDGVNLIPYLTGKAEDRPHDVLYWRRGDDYGIRKGDWKLLWNDSRDGTGTERIELFNLKDDPGEWKDLAANQPERAQMLQNLFDDWDSALPDSMAGIANPKNRRKQGEASVEVTGFNTAPERK